MLLIMLAAFGQQRPAPAGSTANTLTCQVFRCVRRIWCSAQNNLLGNCVFLDQTNGHVFCVFAILSFCVALLVPGMRAQERRHARPPLTCRLAHKQAPAIHSLCLVCDTHGFADVRNQYPCCPLPPPSDVSYDCPSIGTCVLWVSSVV